jgi:hypothetical protein
MIDKKSLVLIGVIATAHAQSFNSGSTGADGALVLTTPGTITFDPKTFNPPLNPSGDNIYHFTNIHVGSGVTLRLSSKSLRGPVFWLSQGPVWIDGKIDLEGADGSVTPSIAGAGGFSGGAVRKLGYGPAGYVPNIFLVPLLGGRGGDGGEILGGGAGGGALLIASSTSITVNGTISANGGSSTDGTGGSGGAIRLVAPVIRGSTGVLGANGGQPQGTDGLIRFETFDNQFWGSLNHTPFAQGKPLGLFLPPNPQPSVRIVSIDGVPVEVPDFTLNQSSAVAIAIEARHIPPGTVIQLEFFQDSGASQNVTTTPLIKGTFEVSLANATVRLPGGTSHCLVKAVWKQPDRAQVP